MKKMTFLTSLAAFALVAVVAFGFDVLPAVTSVASLQLNADSGMLSGLIGLAGMTTLAANQTRAHVQGDRNAFPVIASDIIYAGAAVGLVEASGHARPLVGGDVFGGFAEAKADNSSGSAADINVRTRKRGVVQLSVSGAVITDKGQPVYATDDNTFVFSPVGASFIGFVSRWVSSGVVEVAYDTDAFSCPYAKYGAPGEFELKSGNYTLDIQDNGKVLFVDTDAVVITLPVVATPVEATIVNIGAFGAVGLSVSPNAADMIHAPDLAGVDNKDHINTKATANRGDLVQISSGAGDANGWAVRNQIGTWAQEA